MPERRVVVTGLGAITPIGNDTPTFWSSLLEGRSGVTNITHFDASTLASRIAGEVKGFVPHQKITSKQVKRMERFTQLAASAAIEAFEDAGLSEKNFQPERAGVIIGSGIGSMSIIEKHHALWLENGPKKFSPFMIPMLIINMASGWVSMLLNLKGPNLSIVTACATSNHAIGDAFRIVARGDADIMICGGTESALTPLGVGGFCALKALSKRNDDPTRASRPFDKDRDGFVIAEGAGIVVLEEYEHAKKRNANIYAEVIGYGMSADAYHMTAPHPEGEGAISAMNLAIKDSKLALDEIDYINAHGTSTALNDSIETKAIKAVFGDRAKKIPISSTKSMTGHLLGGAGGVEFVACALSLKDQKLHPTINQETSDPACDLDYVPNVARKASLNAVITNSLGFGGHNTTLVLKKM